MRSSRSDVTAWSLVVIVAVVFMMFAMWLGGGVQVPADAPPKGTSCATAIAPDDIHNWIDRLGGWANYENGYWYDASGSVVGTSSAEDSDVCSYVK
jgi:hypothetical protein